jgi:hypothetical protein
MYDVLIQRIMRLETSLMYAEKRASKLQRQIDDLYSERDNSFKTHEAQYNRMVAVFERLTILEDKIFPKMGPMLDGIEAVVGSFDQWHTNNPLDRRQKSD